MPTNTFQLKTLEDEVNLFHGLVNSITTEAVVVFDTNLNVLFINKAAELLHGINLAKVSPEDFSKHYGLFFPDGITPCLITELPLFKSTREEFPGDIELYVKRSNDTGTPVMATGRPLLDQNGKPMGWLLEFSDISRQKQTENKKSLHAKHLEDAQQLGKIGSWSWDVLNDKVYWSDVLYQIFGLDQKSFPPAYSEYSKIYTAESFSLLSDAIETALRTGISYDLDLEAVHADGTIKKLISRGQVNRDKMGQIVGLTGIAIDISDRKDVDEQLRLIVDMIPMPIFVKDAHSRFLIANKACEELWGFSIANLLGKDGSQFFPPEQMQIFIAKDREVWASQTQVVNEEYVWSEKLKENRLCVTLKKPFYDTLGHPLYLIATTEDITERHYAEQSLSETLASLRAIYDNLPFLAWMKDKEGRYLHANKHWLQAVGITDLNELSGITDFDIWPQELAEHYQSVDQQVIQTCKQISLIESALNKGLETWTETIKAPVIDDQGQVIGTTGLAKDISESRCAEQQMRNYSERLHLACKTAAIGVCEWDISVGLADWDDRMYEIFGIPLGDIIDYSAWARTVFPDDQPNAKAKIRELMLKKQEIHWDFRIYRQNDSTLRYIQASAIASHDDQGKIKKIVGVNIDITDFKQIEMSLREKKTHLAQAQAQAHLGSWSLDIVNNILHWSDECYRIFEIPVGTPLTYECFLALIHPDDSLSVDKAWQAAIQGQPYDIQHRIIVKDKIKWLRERAELEFDADGNLLRGVGTSQDITELKETEHNLELSRLQLRQLAARREKAREEERKRIAREIHDELGQMLTALRMEISLLRIKFASDNKEILENIQGIMGLLDKTIQVTRDVATSLRPSAIEMGLGSALEWLVRKFTEQSGIDCDLFYPKDNFDMEEECSIVIFRIAQESLTNILRHAEASIVCISVKLDADHYYLEIQDNGKGFDSAAIRNTNSFGLIGIQERSIMLGGETSISSSPGKGTFIKVRIPTNTLKQTL